MRLLLEIPLVLLLCSFTPVKTQTENTSTHHILYLAQSQKIQEAITSYETYQKQTATHDFQLLQHMSTIWIEQYARSYDPVKQVLGLFAFSIARITPPKDLLEQALISSSPEVQNAALAIIASTQEDTTELLLNKAMASQYLPIRLEAAFILAQRKAPSALGQIESLMQRLPPPLHAFFPDFFAIIGTKEAIHVLRNLMDAPLHATKVAAILSAAYHERDDLLRPIRAAATHPDHAEKEASAAALGYLKDFHSIKKLEKLHTHPSSSVQLAALYSLYLLGQKTAIPAIIKEAEQENLFAIHLLMNIPGGEEELLPLLQSSNITVRFNTAFTLLHKKRKESLPVLLEFLITDSKNLGFSPNRSPGGSLQAWKVIASLDQHAKEQMLDLKSITQNVKEQILFKAVELPEEDFLLLAEKILTAKENALVPALVLLLENIKSAGSIALLQQQSQRLGAPFIRAYCNLGLCHLKQNGPYQENLKAFLKENGAKAPFRVRHPLPWHLRTESPYQLSAEESTQLLIESYQTLIKQQEITGVEILLSALKSCHPDNIPVLSAILLQMIE